MQTLEPHPNQLNQNLHFNNTCRWLSGNLPAMQETAVWSLGWEDPLEEEMATHSSILAGIVPWREEPGRFQESDTVYRLNHHHHHCDLLIQMHSEARSTAVNQGLPRWLSGKESACQCKKLKRCRLDPWVGKIPWRRKWHLNSGFLPGKSYEQGL